MVYSRAVEEVMTNLAVKQATYQDIIDLPETAWFEVAPDWVCEILSPSTARLDRIVKMPLYAQLGVVHLWLIDPNLQTLEAYQLHESYWLLIGTFANDHTVSIAPFAEHTFSLSDLWE